MLSVTAADTENKQLKPELEQLFREHAQMLYRTAYAMLGSAADAEDVLQSIFLRLLRRELPSDLARNPQGYFYRAAVNTSLNVIRSRKRAELVGDAARFETPVEHESLNADSELHQRLTAAISELEPEVAQVLILRYIHGHTDAEIARMLGVSRGTVAMRLFRSRLRLKKLMQDSTGEKK